jgi:hypothetical protein
MPKPTLNCPRIVPLVGERIAAGVPHLRVGFDLKAGVAQANNLIRLHAR